VSITHCVNKSWCLFVLTVAKYRILSLTSWPFEVLLFLQGSLVPGVGVSPPPPPQKKILPCEHIEYRRMGYSCFGVVRWKMSSCLMFSVMVMISVLVYFRVRIIHLPVLIVKILLHPFLCSSVAGATGHAISLILSH